LKNKKERKKQASSNTITAARRRFEEACSPPHPSRHPHPHRPRRFSRWRYVQRSVYNRNRGITRHILPSVGSLQEHLLPVPSSKTKNKRSSSRRRKRKRKSFRGQRFHKPSQKSTTKSSKTSTRLARMRGRR
jgi:hypothetical protein